MGQTSRGGVGRASVGFETARNLIEVVVRTEVQFQRNLQRSIGPHKRPLVGKPGFLWGKKGAGRAIHASTALKTAQCVL